MTKEEVIESIQKDDRLSKILLLVLNIIIWSIVAFELAYIRPCSANPPPAIHGRAIQV